MANYSLVINSKFQPFSFERYIQPYQIYGEAYKEQELALDTMSAQAETLRQRALNDDKAEWSKKYLEYADKLDKQADELSKKGLSVSSRRALSNLRREYGNSIIAPQEAIKRQLELSKIRQSTNPALRMVYGDMPTIDQLIANPAMDQVGYSGSNVEQSAMQLAATAAARNTSDTFRNFNTYWMQHSKTTGFSKSDIARFMQDASSIPELQSILSQVTNQFGNFEGLSNRQKEQMAGEIMSGILKGATYQQNIQYQQDSAALEALRHQYSLDEMKEKNGIANNGITSNDDRSAFVQINALDTKDSEVIQKGKADLNFIKDILKDPNKLNLYSKNPSMKSVGYAGAYYPSGNDIKYENLEKLQSLGAKYGIKNIAGTNSKGEKYYNSNKMRQLASTIANDIDKQVLMYNTWTGNFADNEKATKIAFDFASNVHTSAPIYYIDEDGKKGDRLSLEEVKNLVGMKGKTIRIDFKNNTPRIIATYEEGSGSDTEIKEVQLPASIFGKLAIEKEALVKQYMEKENYHSATLAIDELSNAIDIAINNRAKMQSNTTDKPIGRIPSSVEEIEALAAAYAANQ